MRRISGRTHQLGKGFAVRRILPHARCRSVGPWVFVDHFGPTTVAPGAMGVRPHPHIGLATVTYLYEGAIVHRDSIGSHQTIRPGAVNLMTAGRGIVHSERSGSYAGELHGLQLWLALPSELQEMEPEFHHTPAAAIESWSEGPCVLRLLMGAVGARTSRVPSRSPTLFLDVAFREDGSLDLPREHDELAVLTTVGDLVVNGEPAPVGTLHVLEAGEPSNVAGTKGARFAVLGGTGLGPRHMVWNFVHTDPARIEAAKELWRTRGFPAVVGDDEYTPLP